MILPGTGWLFRRKRLTSFTLIELLVVVALIAILVTLVLTSVNLVKARAKRMRAKHDVDQLFQAWTIYLQDYKRVPPSPYTPAGGYFFMDSNHIAILRGINIAGVGNPQQIKYMDFSSATLFFCDPWGTRNTITGVYKVLLDEDYDNQINDDLAVFSSNMFLSVGVWSDGPDRQTETGDDVTSWAR